jgi:hypothetical protein
MEKKSEVKQRKITFAGGVKQSLLFPVDIKERKNNSNYKNKQRLRMLHKRLKAGITRTDEVSSTDAELLQKYYGWK